MSPGLEDAEVNHKGGLTILNTLGSLVVRVASWGLKKVGYFDSRVSTEFQV